MLHCLPFFIISSSAPDFRFRMLQQLLLLPLFQLLPHFKSHLERESLSKKLSLSWSPFWKP